MEKEFCYETTKRQRLRVISFAIIILIFLSAIFFIVTTKYNNLITASGFYVLKDAIQKDITELTTIGMFYIGSFGGLFFIPIPIELFYTIGLSKGNAGITSLLLLFAGLLPAHALDYYVGTKFAPVVMNFISKKKIYNMKRKVNKYGPYAIFFLNLIPAPTPILTFALGIAKYNVVRLFIFFTLGTLLKFVIILYIYSIFGPQLGAFLE